MQDLLGDGAMQMLRTRIESSEIIYFPPTNIGHYNLRLRNRDFSLPAKDEKYYIPLEFCIDLVDV